MYYFALEFLFNFFVDFLPIFYLLFNFIFRKDDAQSFAEVPVDCLSTCLLCFFKICVSIA